MEKFGKDIFLLGLVSFFADASSEMIMPVLPFFIASLFNGNGIAFGLAIGLIFGVGDGVASISKAFSGRFSDKIGKRKIFITSGYGLSAISKLFFPFSGQWWHLLFLRIVERIGKGIRGSPRDALIGDLYEKKRGEAYGIHRALDTAGAIAGSLMAFLLFWLLGFEIWKILIIAAFIAFFALPPIIFVREVGVKREVREKRSLSPELKKFIAIATLFQLGNISYAFFLLRIGIESGEKYALLFYAFFNVVYALSVRRFGKISDKIGRRIVIFSGYLLFTLVCIGFVFLGSITGNLAILAAFLLFILYGLVFALIEGNQRALVSDLSEYRGTAQGIFQATIGLAAIPAGIIAGLLWVIPDLTFIYAATLSLLASLLLATVNVERKTQSDVH